MRERGMIFNAEMVRAVMEGRKVQTRRIMKVQPSESFNPMNMALETDFTAHWYTPGVVDKHGYLQPGKKQVFGVASKDEGYTCPFGAVGDRLWVRETHSIRVKPSEYTPGVAWYRESDTGRQWEGQIRWHPSIHMPRWASRITLEITGVRVERLQDISEADCAAEGLGSPFLRDYKKTKFAALWQSIYGVDSWQANPWVWVIEFRKLEAGS